MAMKVSDFQLYVHLHVKLTTGQSEKNVFFLCVIVSEYYILATDADGKIKIWHISTSSCIGTLTEASKQILACAYNSSGDRFVTAGSDTKLNVYDEKTKQVICTLQPRYDNALN